MAVQLDGDRRNDSSWPESQFPLDEAFDYLIQSVAERLSPDDVRSIVHRQKLPQQQRGKTSALEALMQLERRGLFSARDVQSLSDLLRDIRRQDLVDEHVEEYQQQCGKWRSQQSTRPNAISRHSLKQAASGGKSQSQSFPPHVRYRVNLPRQSSDPVGGLAQDYVKPAPQKARSDVQPAFLSPPRKAQSSTLSGDRILQVPQSAAKPHARHHSEPPRGAPCDADAPPPMPRTSTPKSPLNSLLEPCDLPDHTPSDDHLFEAGSRSETSVGSLFTSTSSIEFQNVNVHDYQASSSVGFPQDPDGGGVRVDVAPSLYSIPNSDPNWFNENAGDRLMYLSQADSLASETSELQISDQSAYQYNSRVKHSYTNGPTDTSPLNPADDDVATSLQTMCGSFEGSEAHHMRYNAKDHHRLYTSGTGQHRGTTQGLRSLADTRRWGSDESSDRDRAAISRNLHRKADLTTSLGSYGPLSVVRSDMRWLLKRNDLNKAIYEHKADKFFTSPHKLDVDVGGKANPKFVFHVYPYGLEEDYALNATLEVEIWFPKTKKSPRLPSAVNVALSVEVWDCDTGDCISSCDAEVSMNLRRYTIHRFITHASLKESHSDYIEIQASSELLEPPPTYILGTRL